jgi:hypothetical protein
MLPAGVTWGPKMAALRSDKHRLFCLLMASMPWSKPTGLAVACAKEAGFGSTKSTPRSWASIAWSLTNDQKIQEALTECGRRGLVALGLRGLRRIGEIVEDSSHKDNFRAASVAINSAYSNPSLHLHEHLEHHAHIHAGMTGQAVLDRIHALAKKIGIGADVVDALLHSNNPRALAHSVLAGGAAPTEPAVPSMTTSAEQATPFSQNKQKR